MEVTDDLILQAEQTWSCDILKGLPATPRQEVRQHHESSMLELSLMQAEYQLSKLTESTAVSDLSCNHFSPGCGTSVEYWLRQAEKLMGNAGCEELYPQKADLGYLDGVPNLPWPQQNSEIEELCEGIGRVKLADLNIAPPVTQVSTPVNTHRKPRVNQVKKVSRAKPMVGVKKESKTLTKPEVPSIYISDNSPVVDVELIEIADDENSPLTYHQEKLTHSNGQTKNFKTAQKMNVECETLVPETKPKRGKGVAKTAKPIKISPNEHVTIYNDENVELLAPKRTSRRGQNVSVGSAVQKNSSATRSNLKSNKGEFRPIGRRGTNKLDANSKLKTPEVFSPSPPHNKANTEVKYGYSTPFKSPGISSWDSPGIRTPVSCSSKKSKLLRDLESDSDNDNELLAPKKAGKVIRGKKQTTANVRAAKSRGKSQTVRAKEETGTISSRIPKHILYEVQNSPLLNTSVSTSKPNKSTGSRLSKSAAPSTLHKSKASGTEKSHVEALFKKVLTKTIAIEVEHHNERIYDFVASSPEETIKSKNRKPGRASTNPKAFAARSKLSLKARRNRIQTEDNNEDVENVRKQTEEQNDINIYDFDECAGCTKDEESVYPSSQNKVNNSKHRKSKADSETNQSNEKKPVKTQRKPSRGTGRGRLTRATTAVTEEIRTRDRYVEFHVLELKKNNR